MCIQKVYSTKRRKYRKEDWRDIYIHV